MGRRAEPGALLRIAHVTPYYHPHVGGVETYVRNIARLHRAQGHEVCVLTSRHDRQLPREEVVEGVPVVRVAQRAHLFATPITPGLRGAVRAGGFDLVHLHAPPPLSSYYAAKGAAAAGIPVVMTYHCDLEIHRRLGGTLAELYRRTLGAATLRRTAAIVATSDSYAATSRAVWDRAARIIPVGVELERFRPGLAPAPALAELPFPFVILFVGRLAAHKGVPTLLEALGALPRQAGLVIVGGGPMGATVRQRVAELGLQERVHLAGPVDSAALPHYYAAASAFVLPSTSRLEAFGIATLEAMASGLPVITSDMPGVRELVEHGVDGLLCQPFDPKDLAAQLRRLIDDPQLAATLGRNARHSVERRFSWEGVSAQLLEVYRSVLDDHVRRALPS